MEGSSEEEMEIQADVRYIRMFQIHIDLFYKIEDQLIDMQIESMERHM